MTHTAHAMTAAELAALPVSVDLLTAARAFGLPRTTAYELVRRGEFPCRVLRVGRQFRITRHDLLAALGEPGQPGPTAA